MRQRAYFSLLLVMAAAPVQSTSARTATIGRLRQTLMIEGVRGFCALARAFLALAPATAISDCLFVLSETPNRRIIMSTTAKEWFDQMMERSEKQALTKVMLVGRGMRKER